MSKDRGPRGRGSGKPGVSGTKIFIYGKHALTEALENAPKAVQKVFLAPSVDDQKLKQLITKRGLSINALRDSGAYDVERGASHQGVIAQITIGGLMRSYDEFISQLSITPNTSLVLLDELQDPHNVGAIIRSAAAFGVSGVLIPEHNQAPVTGAVVKVSAGMTFRVPLITIGNVNQTLRDLKDAGFWIYGLAGEGTSSLPHEQFERPSVIVVGNEGDGIRQKTRELCDTLISIPMDPRCESLNAAAAAAVSLYAWSTRHPEAVQK
jgi:23S rRNA (guanosine2251-2'-O)-methyltransferase